MVERENAVKRPLFAAGLTAVAVTAAALKLPWWLSLSCTVLSIGWLTCRRRFLCGVTALLFLVLSMGWRHWFWLPAAGLDGDRDTLSGVVTDTPIYGDMYTVRVTASTRLRVGTQVMLQCDGDDRPRLGAAVTAAVRLRTVEDNQTYYASLGVFVCAFPDDNVMRQIEISPDGETPLSSLGLRLRRALLRWPRRELSDRESSIVAALCFGERDFLSAATVAAFQGSGLSHLLVVSGLHLSMVVLAVGRFFRRVGKHPTRVVTLLSAWLFAWLVGFSPSVIRAATMCTVWLVGGWLFCRSDGLNSLGLAALILLAANPYTLWNAVFQLSFAATAGVLLLAPRLVPPRERSDPDEEWWVAFRRWLRYTVVSGGATCVCALLFTLPIAAYHYGGFPVTAVVANVLAVPVGGAVLLLGWLGAVLGWVPFLGWLSRGCLFVTGMLSRYLIEVAEICSPEWAWLTISRPWQWALLAAVCVAVVCAILWRIPWRRVAASLAALIVLTAAVGIPLTVTPFCVTVVPSDNRAGFILRQGRHCALLLTDAAELSEVVYTAAPFAPEVVFVGENAASALPQSQHFPAAEFLSVRETDGAAYCPVGSTVTLWRGCFLTVVSHGRWRLETAEGILWICTDRTSPPPADGMCVYVGGVPDLPPRTPYVVTCNERYLRLYHPAITGDMTLIVRQSKTFTPKRGEWRVSL